MNILKQVYQNKTIWPIFMYLLLIILLKLINVENILINKFLVNQELAMRISIQIGYLTLLIIPFLLIIELVKRKKKYTSDCSYKSTFALTFFPGFIVAVVLSVGAYGASHDKIEAFLQWFLIFGIILSLISGFFGVLIDFVWTKISKLKIVNKP